MVLSQLDFQPGSAKRLLWFAVLYCAVLYRRVDPGIRPTLFWLGSAEWRVQRRSTAALWCEVMCCAALR
jgi:hypothetical protein